MSYYIKGNNDRGKEVIKALEDKGGVNIKRFQGTDYVLYYIGKDNVIESSFGLGALEYLITIHLTELTLPEEKAKFKVGDKVYSLIHKCNGTIRVVDTNDESYKVELEDCTPYWFSEFDLKKLEWTPKQGEKVLVRNTEENIWREGIFSFKDMNSDIPIYYLLGGNCYLMCIPYDESKLGKVTD